MASSAAALKVAAIWMLVLCVGSEMAPVLASPEQEAAAGALLQELMEHELASELGLHDNIGDVCPQACQTCLIICAITCVLKPDPIACFANCTVTGGCFPKTMVA